MFQIFNVGGVTVEVMTLEVQDRYEAPHMELVTVFSSIVEGTYVTHSTAQAVSPFAGAKEIEQQFLLECSKYAFLQRPTKAKD